MTEKSNTFKTLFEKSIGNVEARTSKIQTKLQVKPQAKPVEKKPVRKCIQTRSVFKHPYKGYEAEMYEIIPDFHDDCDDITSLLDAAMMMFPLGRRLSIQPLKRGRERLYAIQYRGRVRLLIFTDIPVRGAANFNGLPLEPWETIFRFCADVSACEGEDFDLKLHFKSLTAIRPPAYDHVKTLLISSFFMQADELNAGITDPSESNLIVATLRAEDSRTHRLQGDTALVSDAAMFALMRLPEPKKEYLHH